MTFLSANKLLTARTARWACGVGPTTSPASSRESVGFIVNWKLIYGINVDAPGRTDGVPPTHCIALHSASSLKLRMFQHRRKVIKRDAKHDLDGWCLSCLVATLCVFVHLSDDLKLLVNVVNTLEQHPVLRTGDLCHLVCGETHGEAGATGTVSSPLAQEVWLLRERRDIDGQFVDETLGLFENVAHLHDAAEVFVASVPKISVRKIDRVDDFLGVIEVSSIRRPHCLALEYPNQTRLRCVVAQRFGRSRLKAELLGKRER